MLANGIFRENEARQILQSKHTHAHNTRTHARVHADADARTRNTHTTTYLYKWKEETQKNQQFAIRFWLHKEDVSYGSCYSAVRTVRTANTVANTSGG